ncbi:hypothetical protein B0H19DRAFT_1062579 [Mycena capillaripes]|nr:hypothetical protein B0H19DRAFT_1062579 [Mycena capillaripes]
MSARLSSRYHRISGQRVNCHGVSAESPKTEGGYFPSHRRRDIGHPADVIPRNMRLLLAVGHSVKFQCVVGTSGTALVWLPRSGQTLRRDVYALGSLHTFLVTSCSLQRRVGGLPLFEKR